MAPTLETILTILDNFYGMTKRLNKYTASWDGQSRLNSRESGILGFDHAILNAGETLEDMQWLDTEVCGRPYLKLLVNAAATGVMDIRVVIEYGQLETLLDKGVSIIPIRRQQHIFAETVEYAPELEVFVCDVAKNHGRFFRAKSIKNAGNINVKVTAKYPSTLKIRDEGVYDYVDVTMEAF